MSRYYNLCWASGKGIERSLTDNLAEAQVMARVMSRGNDNASPQTIMIVDNHANPVMFIHNGNVFIKENKT